MHWIGRLGVRWAIVAALMLPLQSIHGQKSGSGSGSSSSGSNSGKSSQGSSSSSSGKSSSGSSGSSSGGSKSSSGSSSSRGDDKKSTPGGGWGSSSGGSSNKSSSSGSSKPSSGGSDSKSDSKSKTTSGGGWGGSGSTKKPDDKPSSGSGKPLSGFDSAAREAQRKADSERAFKEATAKKEADAKKERDRERDARASTQSPSNSGSGFGKTSTGSASKSSSTNSPYSDYARAKELENQRQLDRVAREKRQRDRQEEFDRKYRYEPSTPTWTIVNKSYSDPYSKRFNAYALSLSDDTLAELLYHHRYNMASSRYSDLLGARPKISSSISRFESGFTSRNKSYLPPGAEQDLLFAESEDLGTDTTIFSTGSSPGYTPSSSGLSVSDEGGGGGWTIFLILILLVILGVGVAWFFAMNSTEKSSSNTKDDDESSGNRGVFKDLFGNDAPPSVEAMVRNPTKAKIGSPVDVGSFPYSNSMGRTKLIGIREVTRNIGGTAFVLTDYICEHTAEDGSTSKLVLRYNPRRDRSPGDSHVLLLKEELSQGYDDSKQWQEEHFGKADITSPDGGKYDRIEGQTDPYPAKILELEDRDGDGLVERSELEKGSILYCDYVRQVERDGLAPYDEFAIAEVNDKTGWLTIYRGKLIPESKVHFASTYQS